MKAEKNDLVGIYVKNLLFDSLPVDLHVILHSKYAPLHYTTLLLFRWLCAHLYLFHRSLHYKSVNSFVLS